MNELHTLDYFYIVSQICRIIPPFLRRKSFRYGSDHQKLWSRSYGGNINHAKELMSPPVVTPYCICASAECHPVDVATRTWDFMANMYIGIAGGPSQVPDGCIHTLRYSLQPQYGINPPPAPVLSDKINKRSNELCMHEN